MTMPKQMRLFLAAATLSAASAVCSAQAANQSGPAMQTEAAPIERAYPNQNANDGGQLSQSLTETTIAPGGDLAPAAGEEQANPITGVTLRVGPQSSVEDVSSTAQKLELRVEHGVANVNVYKPAKNALILVDLPGGQTQILKDGLYTFNAQTNTARVLHGEALAFPAGGEDNAKPIKVKQDNEVVYNGSNVRPHEFAQYEASADLLPGPAASGQEQPYAYGPYGDGFYPYYAYGYPGPWGYPYYPYDYGFYPFGLGIGFGYYGGYHGYHGGYGFHGGGFHGAGGGFHGGGFHGGGRGR